MPESRDARRGPRGTRPTERANRSCRLPAVGKKPEGRFHFLAAGSLDREEQHECRDYHFSERPVPLGDIEAKGLLDRFGKLNVQGMAGRLPARGAARTAADCLSIHAGSLGNRPFTVKAACPGRQPLPRPSPDRIPHMGDMTVTQISLNFVTDKLVTDNTGTPPRPRTRPGGTAPEGASLPMRDEDNPFTRPLRVRAGILVTDGYGVNVYVRRGRLAVEDGVGPWARRVELHRATCKLRRLVVLGEAGFVTLEAVRWLAGIGASLVHLDRDGSVLAYSGDLGADLPALRRAQALAAGSEAGLEVARYLVAEKLRGQAGVASRIAGEASAGIMRALNGAESARDLTQLRLAEADGASSYWSAWEDVPVRFARRDEPHAPDHWRTFGKRTSPLTGSPRLAANPANAMLNYLYAILETEARIACLAVGLDPGLGVLHADQRSRDSMALDVMEAARPAADALLLDLLTSRSFRLADFHEDRRGSCRLLRVLAHELAAFHPQLGFEVAPFAETVARMLVGAGLPTPLTQDNRSAGRDGIRRGPRKAGGPKAPRPSSACRFCGVVLQDPQRRVCDDCMPEHRREHARPFADAGPTALARLRAQGRDPTATPEARAKQGRSMSKRNREQALWDRENPEADRDPETFRREVLPGLAGVPLRRMVEATGLSLRHCSRIRRGEAVPHPRHWETLRGLSRETARMR